MNKKGKKKLQRLIKVKFLTWDRLRPMLEKETAETKKIVDNKHD